MKTPLHYQISEYDCGPTSMLNAMSFLFSREELPPEILRNTMLYCLDCYGKEGHPGKSGTSCMAMMFLSNWLASKKPLHVRKVHAAVFFALSPEKPCHKGADFIFSPSSTVVSAAPPSSTRTSPKRLKKSLVPAAVLPRAAGALSAQCRRADSSRCVP